MAVDALTEIGYFDEQATNVFSGAPAVAAQTVNVDQFGVLKVLALSVPITSITPSSASGNGPVDLQKLTIRLQDNGTPQAVAFGSLFEALGAALITTTIASSVHTLEFRYSTDRAKWGCTGAVHS